MHIGFHFQWLARRWASRTALVENGRLWSYGELVARMNRVGHALSGLGLEGGDRVALLLPDIREYLEVDYGVMAAGLVRVPLDPRLGANDLSGLLADADPRALVCHASFAEKLTDLADGLPDHVVSVGGAPPGALGYEALLAKASDRPHPIGSPEDLATLNYSGGTTGAPKATMLTHGALMSAAHNTILGFGIRPADVFLNVRPLWPIAQVLAMSHIMAGSAVVLGGRFDPSAFPAQVEASGANRSSLVPTLLYRLLERFPDGDQRLKQLEAIYVGGARIAPRVFEHALEAIGPRIGVLYGLTEAPVSCYLHPDDLADPERRARLVHSAGQPLFGYDLAVRDERGGFLDVGQPGEITLRGPNMMTGYWNRLEATAHALRDGWLHTGDIGEIDSAGYLHVVGRLKQVIRTGSTSVVPEEVEDVLAQHPAVAEAAVVGLPHEEWGEIVAAFVVIADGRNLSEEGLVEFCRKRLAGYKRPRRIEFVASLPRSHYGKVLKQQLIRSL